MTEGIILALVGIAEAVITALITFRLTKRKYNSEVDSNVINNMKESLDFYKQLSDDNKERLATILELNEKLERSFNEFKALMYKLMDYICTDLACLVRKQDLNMCPYFRNDKHIKDYCPNEDELDSIALDLQNIVDNL